MTGDPAHPVAVRPDANGAYRVGLPFHAGLPWKAMDAGLKGMSAVLARR